MSDHPFDAFVTPTEETAPDTAFLMGAVSAMKYQIECMEKFMAQQQARILILEEQTNMLLKAASYEEPSDEIEVPEHDDLYPLDRFGEDES